MAFSWVLFDADGVLQKLRTGWLEAVTEFGGEQFVIDLFSSERLCMAGQDDFSVVAKQVCVEHGVTAPLEEVLEPSHRIEVDQAMLDAVRSLQACGVRCALTTNQQNERGAWMQQNLPYGTVFDQSFYSFELGFAKPDPGYFRTILDCLDVPAEDVLFLDDKGDNVESARSLGLTAEVFPADGGIGALRPLLTAHGLG